MGGVCEGCGLQRILEAAETRVGRPRLSARDATASIRSDCNSFAIIGRLKIHDGSDFYLDGDLAGVEEVDDGSEVLL